MTKPQTNCITVLNRLAKMCADDEDFAEALSGDLNTMLDEIHSQDGFGTEGQSDPRGDFRNGRWSMRRLLLALWVLYRAWNIQGTRVNGPRPICAGCEKPTTWQKPICDDCLRSVGEVPRPYCPLCEVGLTVDRHGIHTTKTGGYAGMCAALYILSGSIGETMSERPIPPDSLEYNRRATVAGLYSQVLRAISRKMLNEQELAERTGRSVEAVRRRLASMRGWSMNDVSDFLLACDMEPRLNIVPEEPSDNG